MKNKNLNKMVQSVTLLLNFLILFFFITSFQNAIEIDELRYELKKRLVLTELKFLSQEKESEFYDIDENIQCRIDYDNYLMKISRVSIYVSEKSREHAIAEKCIPKSICKKIFKQVTSIFPVGAKTDSYILEIIPHSKNKREIEHFKNARTDKIYKKMNLDKDNKRCIDSFVISYIHVLSGKVQSKTIKDKELGTWLQKYYLLVSGKLVEVSKEMFNKTEVGNLINLRVISWNMGIYICEDMFP